MHINGAAEEVRPRKGKSYLWAIYLMFIIILILCVNNYVVYQAYKDLRHQLDTVLQEQRVVENEKKNLAAYWQQLSEESRQLEEKYNEIIKQNEELIKRNKELADDNIALQNSLKMAASAGVKPQNYTEFKELPSRGEVDRGKYVGKFLGTAYTPSKEECGNNKGITNSGKPIIPGVSIAVDNKHWPFGTVFYIKGLGYAVAMDTGSAIKGKYRFDFSVFDRNFARTLGLRKWDVYLVKTGNGKVGSVELPH